MIKIFFVISFIFGTQLSLAAVKTTIKIGFGEFLPIFCKENNVKEDVFLISKVKDNFYRMSFVGLKDQKDISIKYLNSLLTTLENSGKLSKLRAKYNLNN